MSLDLFNNIDRKENKIINNLVNSFIKELSDFLKNKNNSEILMDDYQWNDLSEEDLILYNEKITVKYRDKILTERSNILTEYAENTKEDGMMYYIYSSSCKKDSYNLCICEEGKSRVIITKQASDLPKGATLGSVLIQQGKKMILDTKATKLVGQKINTMIKEKIKEQNQYLESKRIDGHIYKVDEKDSGRVWLYDLSKRN